MGSILSKHDEDVTSPITKSGFHQTQNPSQGAGQKYIKMRIYNSVIPEIQKKLGEEQASYVVKFNQAIQRQFFWASMISFSLTTMINLAFLKRQRLSFHKKNPNVRFPLYKLIKYLPLSFVLLSAFNLGIFNVLEKTSNNSAEMSDFLSKNEVVLNQIVKQRYGNTRNLESFTRTGRQQRQK